MLRDHQPLVIETFNGLWARGDAEVTPIDHFSDCENIQFIHSGFKTRDGLDTYIAKGNVLRIYNYVMNDGESILLLDTSGQIWHALIDGSNTVYGPILTIASMTDFGFISINGRAYITPYTTFTDSNGINYQKGISGEFVYVYKGDGTAARKAAGPAPSNGGLEPFAASNSTVDGVVTAGVHIIAVSFDGGILGPQIFPVVTAPGDKEIVITGIPIGPGGTTSRTIAMTRAIDPKDYVADQTAFTYYTVITIADNTTTTISINTADAGLTTVYVPGAPAAPTYAGLSAQNTDIVGHNDPGLHIIGVVYETDTGYDTAPGPEFFAVLTTVDQNRAITISNIPVSPNSYVTGRRLVATQRIISYNGDQTGFQFFFIPDGDIDDNTTTSITLSFYDSELLEDASHLMDNFEEIPAGVTLASYHNRMVLTTTFDDISVAYLSAPNEPEAINQVDGLIIAPLDGNPLTNAQEYRDVLYLFKKTRTLAYVDNGDEPSSWEGTVIDQGIGASVHGIATVLDSGGVNADFLIIIDYSGVMLFNGAYARPELSWKIKDYWFTLDHNDFANLQIMNDSLTQILYITLPNKKMLIGDYSNAMTVKDIRWAKWRFDIETTTITLIEINKLIIGSQAAAS